MKKLFNRLEIYLSNVYWCVIPFGTIFAFKNAKKRRKLVYDAIDQLMQVDDESYETLRRLGFQSSDSTFDIRKLEPRGRYCPDELLPEFVELEFENYFNDQMMHITQQIGLYTDLPVSCQASYLTDSSDMVLLTYGYEIDEDIWNMFKSINYIITGLTISIITLTTVLVLS